MTAPTPHPSRPAPSDGSSREIGWGLVGAGRFTPRMARTVAATPGHRVVRVGARDVDRAAALAAEVGGQGGHYDAAWSDSHVDVVYVSTTHPFHEEQALAAIDAGKAVLVEKPMALTAGSARRIAEAARAAGVLAMEAMWLRHQELVRTVVAEVRAGAIGEVVSVQADFGAHREYDPSDRLFDRANGGGALLDLGVYAAAFAWPFLGRPDVVQCVGALTPQGTDHTAAMQWGYDDGRVAQLTCTFRAPSPGRGLVTGTEGWIEVAPHYAKAPGLAVVHDRSSGATREIRLESRGYVCQVEEVGRCLREGLLESPDMPLDDTIGVLEVLDRARAQLGVEYPER
ncbi:Gfo/Idh/MocA family protein [Mobilicoccus pelagius]|uniref:Putative oxidoreductase n=1 Tax=Mobilicoccus pelagius NBRC 104925 TaxID=1089455 RepID=H5UNE2_9MICO|nr:Gfo/Idh/MocA family oxidoreductase [Mobilicoccus pelagius]GAB47250.1 putative oxidoreductase [Mobilicoccus pelagius NBRC 104925]